VRITTEIRGVDEILRNVRALGTVFSTDVEEGALKKMAQPYAEDIANVVDAEHHDTGLTGADITFAVSREAKAEGSAAVLIGATGRKGRGHGRAFILSFLEFGTFRQPGHHIVAGVFRSRAPTFTADMAKQLEASFKRARAKFLRRAA
jgi:HK97 gp10 family phage protein